MSKTARLPSSEAARRIAAIFHRQLTTKWHEKKEIPQFRALLKDGCFATLDDLAKIERYYKANWPPRHGKNSLRTDLATLLNNWQGELDRATAWCEAHPLKPKPRVIIQMPPTPSEPMQPLSAEDQEQADNFMRQLRQKQGRPAPVSTFQQVKQIMSGE